MRTLTVPAPEPVQPDSFVDLASAHCTLVASAKVLGVWVGGERHLGPTAASEHLEIVLTPGQTGPVIDASLAGDLSVTWQGPSFVGDRSPTLPMCTEDGP
jgi:hypothetical protein